MSDSDLLMDEYTEEMQNLAEKYMIKTSATEEDLIESSGVKKGDLINQRHPIPNDKNHALELLKNFYGAYEVARLKFRFIHIYHSWNKAAIEAEINHLEAFRNEALDSSKKDYPEACIIGNSLDNGKRDNEKFMFLRLYHGFYNDCRHIGILFFNSYNEILNHFDHGLLIVKVYGKYFLYYDFLKEKLKSINKDVEDPYSISWSSNNYIEFRKKKIYFPFDSYRLAMTITSLRDKLLDKDVCAIDLQNYPHNIFSETELSNYPDLAAWVYNIIETWVHDVQKTYPSHGYPKLFDNLLESCEDLAKQAKEPPGGEPSEDKGEAGVEKTKVEDPEMISVKEEVECNLTVQEQQKKFSIPAYAIMHVYLSMFSGQPVTQQNKNTLIKKYGYNSGQQLRHEYTFYESEDNRLRINEKNKKSAKAHIERFKDVITLLKDKNERAYLAAKADLAKLEKEYNKYH